MLMIAIQDVSLTFINLRLQLFVPVANELRTDIETATMRNEKSACLFYGLYSIYTVYKDATHRYKKGK